jgi:hypothetical protein
MGALHIPPRLLTRRGESADGQVSWEAPQRGSGHAALHAVAPYFNESRHGESPTPRADVLGPMVTAASPDGRRVRRREFHVKQGERD